VSLTNRGRRARAGRHARDDRLRSGERQRFKWSDPSAPWNPTAADRGSYPDSIIGGSSLNCPEGLAFEVEPAVAVVRSGLAVVHRSDGPISSASTSVTGRRSLGGLPGAGLVPAEDDHAVTLWIGSRRRARQAAPEVDPKKEVWPSFQLSPPLTRVVTATRRLATAAQSPFLETQL
jgi:hypothetical protein